MWEVFQAGRGSLIGYRGPFDGFREIAVAVSKSSLVRFDRNRYSVAAKAARRPAQRRVCADRAVAWCGGEILGEHRRRFGRGRTAYDPLGRLGALPAGAGREAGRSGTATRSATGTCRRPWRRPAGGSPATMTAIASSSISLTAAADCGLDAAEAACAAALTAKLCGRDVVLNILARQRDAAPPRPAATPAADCARYDRRRRPPAAEEVYRGAA